jgi:pimeloyl-ACP methyl ester carboxylesterase
MTRATSNRSFIARRTALMSGSAAMGLAVTAPARAQSTVTTWRHYAKCRFGQIHFTSASPDREGAKTPLVCLHQSPVSGGYYKEFQAVMAADRLVMCPDTPGYGNSDNAPAQPDMAALGAAMAEALTDLGYGAGGKGPVDWLGFHTGNFVITEVVAQRPDLVRRLVMPGIPYYPAAEREGRRKQFAQPRPYFTDPDFVGKNYRDTVLGGDGGIAPDRKLELFASRLQSGPNSWWGFDAVFRYDADAALAKVTQPVLCPILDETLAEPTRQAAKLMKKAASVELPDLKGSAWQTAPDKLAAVIRPFLDKA